MSIEIATEADLGQIADLLEERDGDRMSDMQLFQMCFGFDPTRGFVLVARRNRRIYALSLMERRPMAGPQGPVADWLYWENLYVAADMRGMGTLGGFFQAAKDIIARENLGGVHSAVHRPNVLAVHHKNGLVTVDRFDVCVTRVRPMRVLSDPFTKLPNSPDAASFDRVAEAMNKARAGRALHSVWDGAALQRRLSVLDMRGVLQSDGSGIRSRRRVAGMNVDAVLFEEPGASWTPPAMVELRKRPHGKHPLFVHVVRQYELLAWQPDDGTPEFDFELIDHDAI